MDRPVRTGSALASVALAAVVAAPFAGSPAASGADAVRPTAVPSDARPVTLGIDTARWESGYGERFFQVVGTVRNGSPRAVGAVRIRTELLDAAGAVVATFDGWNGKAESLGELTGDEARAALAARAPAPIPAGGSDRFRATFLADETPAFASQRVVVVDVLTAP